MPFLYSVENFLQDRHKPGLIWSSFDHFIAGKLQMAQLTQLGANFDPIHICWDTFSAISADPLNRIGPFEWQNVPHKVLLALTQLLRGLLAALCRYWTFCDLYLKIFEFFHLQMTFSVPRRHLLGSRRAVLDSVENFL